MKRKQVLTLPDGEACEGVRLVLHACCAPCSAAVVEKLLAEGARPLVFFSNANIVPMEEYIHRRQELERLLTAWEVPYAEDAYDHAAWLRHIEGLEHEPERGRRCAACFLFRLRRTALFAQEQGIGWIATTLASSRWKDLNQVNAAGIAAVDDVPGVSFWANNWRRGGLQERRGELIKVMGFYNQRYCGCEFSLCAGTSQGSSKPQGR